MNFAQKLQETHLGCMVNFRPWMGTSKAISKERKAEAAAIWETSEDEFSASRKLFDTANSHYKAIVAKKNEIGGYWEKGTLPFPQPSTRLLKREKDSEFEYQMGCFSSELEELVVDFDPVYRDLISQKQFDQQKLFNPDDYPSSVIGRFGVQWSFPPLSAPDYLSDGLFAKESERMQARFDEALQMAEASFFEELDKLVSKMIRQLSGDEDGKQKRFYDSTITQLKTFFGRFQDLSIGSNEDLEALVYQAHTALLGVNPAAVRDNDALRERVRTSFSALSDQLATAMSNVPARKIRRSGAAAVAAVESVE
jgi:hypothetical protein